MLGILWEYLWPPSRGDLRGVRRAQTPRVVSLLFMACCACSAWGGGGANHHTCYQPADKVSGGCSGTQHEGGEKGEPEKGSGTEVNTSFVYLLFCWPLFKALKVCYFPFNFPEVEKEKEAYSLVLQDFGSLEVPNVRKKGWEESSAAWDLRLYHSLYWAWLWAQSRLRWPKSVLSPVQVTDICHLVWCSNAYKEIYLTTVNPSQGWLTSNILQFGTLLRKMQHLTF